MVGVVTRWHASTARGVWLYAALFGPLWLANSRHHLTAGPRETRLSAFGGARQKMEGLPRGHDVPATGPPVAPTDHGVNLSFPTG